MNSILIQNGNVFDSKKGTFTHASVSLNFDVIKAIEEISEEEASIIIDASNLYVTPGLIDFHGHFFEKGSEIGVNPDLACLPFGVTGAVDAGSSGISNFESFSSQVLKTTLVTMKCFLNVSPIGLITTKFHENIDPKIIDENKIISLLKNNKDSILGLKLRMSKEVVMEHGMEPLKKARLIADKIGCKINVHVTNPTGTIAELLQYFKAGDIFTHVFHGKGETIIKDGKVIKEIREARKKGVIFDAANGGNHFSFDVAQNALKDGFLPDIISTDITKNTLMKPPVFSLVNILTKYLALGVDFADLIPMCTSNAAKIMGLEKTIGDILPGKNADIALFNIIDQTISFNDFTNKTLVGQKNIEPVMTLKNGVIVYLNPTYVHILRRG